MNTLYVNLTLLDCISVSPICHSLAVGVLIRGEIQIYYRLTLAFYPFLRLHFIKLFNGLQHESDKIEFKNRFSEIRDVAIRTTGEDALKIAVSTHNPETYSLPIPNENLLPSCFIKGISDDPILLQSNTLPPSPSPSPSPSPQPEREDGIPIKSTEVLAKCFQVISDTIDKASSDYYKADGFPPPLSWMRSEIEKGNKRAMDFQSNLAKYEKDMDLSVRNRNLDGAEENSIFYLRSWRRILYAYQDWIDSQSKQ